VFVTLYSSLMLSEFEEHRLSVLEAVVYFWQFTLIADMLKAVIQGVQRFPTTFENAITFLFEELSRRF
jgi:hypothetical protein